MAANTMVVYGIMWNMGHVTKLLHESDIIAQYITSNTPEQECVAERCNHTLKDMARSMLSNSTLVESLWRDS